MTNPSVSTDSRSTPGSRVVPWTRLERRASYGFAVGGALLLASLVVPVGVAQFTEWAWVSGLFLVGFGALAVATGLLGLYPGSDDPVPGLSVVGAFSSAVAGVAAAGLVAMGALALAGGATGLELGKPMGVFAGVALSMGAGLALGLFSLGVARYCTDGAAGSTAALLIAGGVALSVPVVGELLRFGVGVGTPPWLLFPVLVAVALDALAVGYLLRREDSSARR